MRERTKAALILGVFGFIGATTMLAGAHSAEERGRMQGLNDLLGEETADISAADAKSLGIGQGEKVRVVSRRGEVTVTARITPQVPPGLVWMAFHFREGCANWLTNPAMDPVSKTAEFKACAVRLEKI